MEAGIVGIERESVLEVDDPAAHGLGHLPVGQVRQEPQHAPRGELSRRQSGPRIPGVEVLGRQPWGRTGLPVRPHGLFVRRYAHRMPVADSCSTRSDSSVAARLRWFPIQAPSLRALPAGKIAASVLAVLRWDQRPGDPAGGNAVDPALGSPRTSQLPLGQPPFDTGRDPTPICATSYRRCRLPLPRARSPERWPPRPPRARRRTRWLPAPGHRGDHRRLRLPHAHRPQPAPRDLQLTARIP